MKLDLLICIININFIYSQLDYTEPKSQWKTPCKDGKRQSPIDFPSNFTKYINTNYIKIISVNYGLNSKGLINGTINLQPSNIHSLNITSELGYIIIEKEAIEYRYDLKQIDFHINSEHKFNGLSGDIEMQLIHVKNNDWLVNKNISSNSDTQNSNLIISILLKVASNIDNPIFTNLNLITKGPVINFDLKSFPPFGKPFLFYLGSLTTPSCEEIVNWIVVHSMEKISKKQYDGFRSWIDISYIGVNNNREVKELNGRQLYYQFYPEQILEKKIIN